MRCPFCASINWALDPHATAGTLDTSLPTRALRRALARFRARLRLAPVLYCITDVRLITLRSATLGKVSEDFILHAISEVSILFLVTQILEREHGDTLFRYRNRRS